MKRIYIKPTSRTRIVKPVTMICESPNGLTGTMGEDAQNSDDPDNNLSKKIWGDSETIW